MPEGDTLFKIAERLRPLLVGSRLEGVRGRTRGLARVEGSRVVSIETRGKHLLIGTSRTRTEPALFLRTHLGLRGSWHQYPPGVGWRKPGWQASLVLETGERTFVCFNARQVDVVAGSRLGKHPALARLGPDLLAEPFDLEQVVARLARRGDDAISTVLLDQRVACGIGNVYKNEVLFLTGHDPRKRLSQLSLEQLREIYRAARRLMQENTGRVARTTTGARPGSRTPRLWVYRRAGRACFRCETRLHFERTRDGRSNYWCPCCQS